MRYFVDVALDANILIADPWFKSQNIRVLIDYVKKTQSKILLFATVEMEVRAHIKRQFANYVREIESAINRADKNNVFGIPSIDADKILLETEITWDIHFRDVFDDSVVKIVPLDVSVSYEALKRAVNRIPPCKSSGEGMRDAIIWISILNYCRKQQKGYNIVFISANTSDFASSDKTTLHPHLLNDLADTDVLLQYFSSLDTFVQRYAKPVSYITIDWINSNIDFEEIRDIIRDEIDSSRNILGAFRIAARSGKYYEPSEVRGISFINIDIKDYYVWSFSESHTELRITMNVDIDADVLCEMINNPDLIDENYLFEEYRYPPRRVFPGSAELEFIFSARIENNQYVSILSVENIENKIKNV
jgi:hypothetical protein